MEETTLKCANCEEEYTHVRGLVWFRRGEDEENCSTLIADFCGQATIETKNDFNPSLRRDGLRIIYWCECCHEFSSMNIVQHKGNTFVSKEKCPEAFLKKSFSIASAEIY